MFSNHFKLKNSKMADIFEIYFIGSHGENTRIFWGTFEQCVIYMILKCPDLRDDLKDIDFKGLQEILKGVIENDKF